MGALLGLAFTVMVIVGGYALFVNPKKRAAFLADYAKQPVLSTLAYLWAACVLLFFWCVLLQVTVDIPTPWGRRSLFVVSGLGSLAGFLVTCVYAAFTSGRRRK